jgi:thioredoxin-dependent peroxiredoxin
MFASAACSAYEWGMLKVDDVAPPFRGTDQNGREVALEGLVEQGPVVLYFYPKDFTRVCTQEACMFRDAYAELKDQAAEIVGVSVDGDETHRKFAEKHDIGFPLLSDKSRSISGDYGVKRLFGLFTKRVTFVIDRERRIRGVFHHELSASQHLEDVRRCLASL